MLQITTTAHIVIHPDAPPVLNLPDTELPVAQMFILLSLFYCCMVAFVLVVSKINSLSTTWFAF